MSRTEDHVENTSAGIIAAVLPGKVLALPELKVTVKASTLGRERAPAGTRADQLTWQRKNTRRNESRTDPAEQTTPLAIPAFIRTLSELRTNSWEPG